MFIFQEFDTEVKPDRVQIKKEKDFFKESRQFSGTRRAHTRRLTTDQKPSKNNYY